MNVRIVLAAAMLFVTSYVVGADLSTEPTQDPDARYRLFRTQNIHTFLKLDTRVGRIWQVQLGEDAYRFSEPLNSRDLVAGSEPGRFTLYPTANIYTFVLLDQVTGDAWQVQWGKLIDRMVVPIKDLSEVIEQKP